MSAPLRFPRPIAIFALALVGIPGTPASAPAQRATIVGQTVVKGSVIPVGYAVVGIGPVGRDQFTDDQGRFTISDVPIGLAHVSAKHIGYAPFDTTIAVTAGDTIRVRLELSLITIELPAVHSLAKSCAHPGGSNAQVGPELELLFDQVKQNADRNSLLLRSYPVEITIERKITKPEPILEARFVAFDTVRRSGARNWTYAPGKMLGTREYEGGVFGGRWVTVTLPELADFGDERFLVNHCFDFGGLDVVNGDTLLRVDFSPAPMVHTPDVSGTMFLDPKTYQLRLMLVSLVNLTKQIGEQIGGQTIRATFTEVVPGVPVVDVVSSVVFPREDPKKPPREPATEMQRTLRVRFLRGKP